MTLRKSVLGYLGLTVIFLITASVVVAMPFRLEKLPDKGATFGCGTCHVNSRGGGPRNAFGRDYEKVGLNINTGWTKWQNISKQKDTM